MTTPSTFYVSFKQISPKPSPEFSGEAGDATPELLEQILALGEAWVNRRGLPILFDHLDYCGGWPAEYPEYPIEIEDVVWTEVENDMLVITKTIPGVIMRVQEYGNDPYLYYAWEGCCTGSPPELIWPVFDLYECFGIKEDF